jgi:hypothetical protein
MTVCHGVCVRNFLCLHVSATRPEVGLMVPLLSGEQIAPSAQYDHCARPRVCDLPFRQQLRSSEFIYIFSFSMVHMVRVVHMTP